MKSVILTRGYRSDTGTLGIIQIEGIEHVPFLTCERPWKDNAPNISCIPSGKYVCHPFSGRKYKNVYEVRGVKNRAYILFHVGNFPHDSKGCILLGLMGGAKDGAPAVFSSRKAMEEFKKIIGSDPFSLSVF